MGSSVQNLTTIRNRNCAMILKYIRIAPTSRAAIAKLMSMSKSSVTTITNDLIAEGQLVETGAQSTGIGRHPVLLDIVADYRYALGVSIHKKTSSVCIVDLKSNVIDHSDFNTSDWYSPSRLMEALTDELTALLTKHNIPIAKCIGVGVSVPSPVDHIRGKILTPPDFDMFHNVEVGNFLRKGSRFPL